MSTGSGIGCLNLGLCGDPVIGLAVPLLLSTHILTLIVTIYQIPKMRWPCVS